MAIRKSVRGFLATWRDRIVRRTPFAAVEGQNKRRKKLATLLSREDIAARVAELGEEISKTYAGEELIVVCVLKGSFMFYADLLRAIHGVRVRCEFLGVKSYEGETSTGTVEFTQDLRANIEGCHVLLVEDIVDTGRTLNYLVRTLKLRKPKSLRVATLLDKPSRREIEVKVDWTGFKVPNKFVVGYGLDDDGYFRELSEVTVVGN